ncbi:MAG: hypothetical protein ACYCVM_10470, partial [Acidiferrobacter sp.]
MARYPFRSSRSTANAGFWPALVLAAFCWGGPSAAALAGVSVPTVPITGSTIPLGLALNTPGAGTGQTYYVATTGSDS